MFRSQQVRTAQMTAASNNLAPATDIGELLTSIMPLIMIMMVMMMLMPMFKGMAKGFEG